METIYYIDGEAFLRMMVEKRAQAHGLTCYTAENILDGSYMVRDVSPDLVIFDLNTDFQAHRELLLDLVRDTQIPVGVVGFLDEIPAEIAEFCQDHRLPMLAKPLSAQTLIEDFLSLKEQFIALRSEHGS
jgi:DNA-binding response OmpR family regulator